MNMLLDNLIKFLDKHVWIKRIGVYASIFVGITVAFIFIFGLFKLIIPDFSILNNTVFTQYNITELRSMGFFDNERYLISALVQSLAATIALVVSLSLVAVQLAAQSYSTRIIKVYTNNPDMWILLSIYIAVIFYGLGLLKVIDIGVAGINMEFAIFAAYFLGFFAFVCLVPYMLKTLDLLKPSTVIKLLAEKITKEEVMVALKNHEIVSEIDPIQPIIDIVNSALEKNDYETVRNGLKAITNSTVSILEKSHFELGEEDEFSRYIVDSIKNIAISAIQKENTNSTLSAITNLKIIGTKAVENNHEKTAGWTAKVLENIEMKAANADLKPVMLEVVTAIGIIGLEAANREVPWVVGRVAQELEKIGIRSIQLLEPELTQELRRDLEREIIEELRCMGIKSAEKQLNDEARKSVSVLGNMGKKALDKRGKIETNVGIFEKEIIDRFKMRLESLINKTIEALSDIGTKAAEMRIHEEKSKHQGIKEKSEGIVQEKMEIEWEVVGALRNIGEKALEIELENIVIKTAKELENAGQRASEQNLEKTTMKAVEALEFIGMKSMEYNRDLIAKSAAEELNKLWSFLSQKEIMKAAVVKIEDTLNSFASNSVLTNCTETRLFTTRIVNEIYNKSISNTTDT